MTYLLRTGSFTSTNCPNWFISNNYVLPIAYFILYSFNLLCYNSFSLSSFTFFKGFTNTCDNRQSRLKSMIYFFSNELKQFIISIVLISRLYLRENLSHIFVHFETINIYFKLNLLLFKYKKK